MIRDCWVALNSEESIVERKMDSETYRKIGRGGAGNYYSKQDIEDAAKSAAEVCTI